METLLKQRTALQYDLSVETTDVFYTETIIDTFVNRAIKAIANLYPWQETQRAIKRDTAAGVDYYSYPNNIRTDSVYILTVDGEEYKKVTFRDFIRYQENNSGGTEKIYSDYRKKLFIYPTPSTDGTGNINAWGHEVPDELSADTDTHIFSYQSVLEEAIQMYAKGLALIKGRGSHYERGKALMGDALTMAQNEWKAQQRRQGEYKNVETVMWDYQDLLREGNNTRRGTFDHNC